MSLYFFNLQGEKASTLDLVGRHLRSDEAARAEARRYAAELDDSAPGAWLGGFDWLEVLDKCQRRVARLPIGRMVEAGAGS